MMMMNCLKIDVSNFLSLTVCIQTQSGKTSSLGHCELKDTGYSPSITLGNVDLIFTIMPHLRSL